MHKHIKFETKDVYNPMIERKKDKTKIFLHADAEEANKYVQQAWNRDSTFRADDITLSTIHGVKGKEATNVVVCDVWNYPCWLNYTEKTFTHRHEEIRIAYVGVTRSKKRLFMWSPMPNTKKGEHSFDPLQIKYYDSHKPTPRVPTGSYTENDYFRFRQRMEREVYGEQHE